MIDKNNIIFFIDSDHIITFFEKSFYKFINKRLRTNFTLEDFQTKPVYYLWEYPEKFHLTYEEDRDLFHQWCEEGGFKNLEFYPNGEYVNKLYEIGIVNIITTLPDKFKNDRLENYKKLGVKYHNFYSTYKKYKVINEYIYKLKKENKLPDYIYFVEDKLSNFDKVDMRYVEPVIINAGHNALSECDLRFDDLKEFYNYIINKFGKI